MGLHHGVGVSMASTAAGPAAHTVFSTTAFRGAGLARRMRPLRTAPTPRGQPLEPPITRFLPSLTLVGCLGGAPWTAAAEPAIPPTKAQVEALLTKAQDWLL